MPIFEKPNVLLVDDNEAVCTLVSAVLRHEFLVDCLHDGTEAIERLGTKQYAAIILDLRMPNVDGFGVLDFLKANQPETTSRVLILTAAPSTANLARVEEYGVCGVISKPFEIDALITAVKDCIGEDGHSIGSILSSSVILLLAGLLRQRWM